ncbi:cob(II)yrinic acid a,c-diamide reductase [Nakamurella panacisegetis]|uniref:Nicotinate-nucleotide--dimethylbenzimidazole phosphoribosyltransferase n=1 Tax=Nakamurella panacisegetis TaxID=1090615 RepID=A0A1H0LLY3_9ACTN|nr:5,6-dimethylbenzimidazole synthase [Nakamurella panacisegetis]SDO69222.1 cob(II)yrinic acid a,c-diamide reductase [Nakamurella panacisegetis]
MSDTTNGTDGARWSRPVPLIGDRTSAAQRAEDPTGWAFPEHARDAVYEVIRARRDVRRFRPDPVPQDVLDRVLAAGHAAPSVGHSQPWRFIVIRDAETRERAAVLADRERLVQAAAFDDSSGRQLLDLHLEGIRAAPLGVVIACDRRSPAAGVLGRATFPDADLWSCACAIENIWLAARAEGLGLGWVTLFEPADLAGLLHLPDGVVTLGWLCLGWPDERPPTPGLERAGWSKKSPLSDVVLQERWPTEPGRTPGPPRSHLRAPNQQAVVAARDHSDALLTPPGSLGVLDRALDRLTALRRPDLGAATLVLVGADHPVAAFGVSAYPRTVTRQVMTAAVAGEAAGTAAARSTGMQIVLVDAGIDGLPLPGPVPARPLHPVGDLVTTDALHPLDVRRLIDLGRGVGEEATRSGAVALGEVGIGNTTVAAALTAVLLGLEAADVVGLGAGADTDMLRRKELLIGRSLTRARTVHGDGLSDPMTALAALGGPEFAVLTGVVLGAAGSGVPVILDGLATSVAALLAVRMHPAVAAHLIAGHRSREAAHRAVLHELGQEPLLDLRIRAGEGTGACLATGLLKAALATRAGTGRTATRGRTGPG